MTGSRRQHRLLSLLRGPKGRQLLALLLVGTLLLCHGVFGALHLCSAPLAPTTTHQGHEYPPSAEKEMGAHGHPACHVAADYFAVLLTAFLGLILALLMKGARPWNSVAASLNLRCRFRSLILHPPRGPTPPVIQVFRL